MRIYFAQHGIAMEKAADPERPLSASGRLQVNQVANLLYERGIRIGQVFHSGKLRAAQSAEIFAAKLGNTTAQELAGMQPNDDPAIVASELLDGCLYVGHLPHLQRLTNMLLGCDQDSAGIQFTNAGVACIVIDESGSRLQWYLVPGLC